MQKAFIDGRADNDPSKGTYWYQRELDFFDQQVIPLAKRIVELRCFGSLGEEFLQNAGDNRREWSDRGSEIIKKLLAASEPLKEETREDTNDGSLPSLLAPSKVYGGTNVLLSGSSHEGGGRSKLAGSEELAQQQADESVGKLEMFQGEAPSSPIKDHFLGAKSPTTNGVATTNGNRNKPQSTVRVSQK